MKKVFEIEYGDGIGLLTSAGIKLCLEEFFIKQMYKFEVTEIEDKKHKVCPHEWISDGKCSLCDEPINLKPPIEKLDAERKYDFSLSGLCQEVAKIASKQEEIIDWIGNTKRG